MGIESFFGSGLDSYAHALRTGRFTIEEATRACLTRIAETNEKLESFVHVAEESAVDTAAALDRLLRSGTDLGPLMGVPLGVKDLYAVAGMPTGLGSRVKLSAALPEEASFIRMLRAAGCVILGKTRTTEFAIGGINLSHPTPWNPCCLDQHLTPGGSSSGSAVAVASGQCPWGIGSDMGGSIRQPAALCGLVGFKASQFRWDPDGIFSFSHTFDSIGYINATVADAAYVYRGLLGVELPKIPVESLRLGRPELRGFAELDTEVANAVDDAVSTLEKAGVRIVAVDLPDASDIDEISQMVPVEFIGHVGRQKLKESWDQIDPVPRTRMEATLDAADYIELSRRRRRLSEAAAIHMRKAGLDGWVLPTVPHTATPMAKLKTVADATKWNARTFRITRLANMLDQVAISIPTPVAAGALPVGMQICCPNGQEIEMLAIAASVEACLSQGK